MTVFSTWTIDVTAAIPDVLSAALIDKRCFIVVTILITVNVLYTVKLKLLMILDVMCIATRFVLRVLTGSTSASVTESGYLTICTITLSLLLGFSKRRHKIALSANDAKNHHKVLVHCSSSF